MSYDPTIGRWTSEDPIAFEGGDANLYRYVGNDAANAVDPSGLYFARKNLRTGKWEKVPDADILKSLADKLGVKPDDLKLLQDSDLWKCLVNSAVPIEFHFYNLKGGKYNDYGGYTVPQDDGSILVVVAPDNATDPKQLLYNFIHELIHANLRVGCNVRMGKDEVRDRIRDRDTWPTGYPDYPGRNDPDDINRPGQGVIDWYKDRIRVPPRFPVFPVPEDR
jgi:hypothetical protein